MRLATLQTDSGYKVSGKVIVYHLFFISDFFLLTIWNINMRNIESNLKTQLLVAKDKIKSTIYHMKFLHLHYGVLTISPASSSSSRACFTRQNGMFSATAKISYGRWCFFRLLYNQKRLYLLFSILQEENHHINQKYRNKTAQ